MKKWFFLLLWPALSATGQEVQQVTLEQVQQWAADNYPLLKKKGLARATALASNENLGKNFLPQVNVLAQASWQSAVTQVPTRISIPGLEFEPLSKDQYRAVAEVNQLLYDGGSTRVQKDLNEIRALLIEEQVNVGLQLLKEKINGIYLNAMLMDEQRKLQALLMADLDAGMQKVETQVQLGTAFRSNLALLQSEKLKVQQKDTELQEEKEGLIAALSMLTGKLMDPDVTLIIPTTATNDFNLNTISRPELSFYRMQDSLTRQQEYALDTRIRPRVSLYANGGYGRPGLDMLKNEFAPFVTTGLRVQWNIGALYTQKKDRELNDIAIRDIEAEQESFILNTQTQLVQQQSVIRKLRRVMETDRQIIELKAQVKVSAKAQLDNGVITASDYLREVHAEDQARQSMALHILQLLQAQISFNTIAGK